MLVNANGITRDGKRKEQNVVGKGKPVLLSR